MIFTTASMHRREDDLMITLYDKLPDMECLSGDSIGTFRISPKSGSFDGCRMQIIVARRDSPLSAVICKECTMDSDGFAIQLTSEETSRLTEGTHVIHFRLVDGNGLSYRKLAGYLYVHQTAQGASLT